jgi:starch synthase (maltosyl-transferring)
MEFTRRRVSIQRVRPEVAQGRFPAKAVAGDPVEVHADIVCDGHDVLRAVVRWQAQGQRGWAESPLELTVNDRWVGAFTPPETGRYRFTVESWVDPVATWQRDLAKKADAETTEPVDLEMGAELLRERAARCKGSVARRLEEFAAAVVDPGLTPAARVEAALSDELEALAADADPREHKTRYDRTLDLHVDRPRAAFSTWYELFPRSASTVPGTHGTLRDVIDRLDHVVGMGFDVLYLPPIHPIGTSHRKGADNTVVAGPEDPGSPWAIGSAQGGHKSIHPQLGDLDDFAALRDACRAKGLELALDIAFQCSPDHPYVTEHPEWFRRRPDGTIQYAENPPKKYQDIYPFDFETSDPEGLWRELKSIFEYWIDQGVRIFRVDNPHTKSLPFWSWCIDELTAEHPDLIFLSEAFTRPKVMQELAMRGFTQSYTYFTWRRHKWEIEEYYTELFQTDVADYLRPNSWPNTPDILTDQLQHGGRPMYVARLVLAATLTANYGMYGPAFELMWSEARPGAEEYAANEKYEIKTWDVDHPDSLREVIALVNRIRHRHPALQRDRSLRFHHVDNDQLLAYSKSDEATGDTVLVVVNLDPGAEQAGTTWLDLEALGLDEGHEFHVHDLFGGGTYLWHGPDNYVHLNPHVAPAHIFQVLPQHRTEVDFDQYQ